MQFVFWQNIISIHQSSFLSVLAEKYPVILVVECDIEDQRKGHGWTIPDVGKSRVIIAPGDQEIHQLIDKNRHSVHVFSGINTFRIVYQAFKLTRPFKLKTFVYVEPYRFMGVKGVLRRLKYLIIFNKYGKTIDGLLPTGELGCRCYQKAGFPTQKIFQWGYFTKQRDQISFVEDDSSLPSLLFVGSIDERKNVLHLIDVCKKMEPLFDHLTIVGTGPLSDQFHQYIGNTGQIRYIGGRTNDEVLEIMCRHDLLVLPSIFDGWGAVVNEALQSGMRVIASENCGASVLLDGVQRGEIFYFERENNLETVLKRWLKKGKPSIEERSVIIQWAKEHISGKVATDYFEQICKYIYENEGDRPVAPWLK